MTAEAAPRSTRSTNPWLILVIACLAQFNTAQQGGGSLGLAILSTLAASQTTSLLQGLRGHATATAVTAAGVSGYHVAFAAAAIMLAAGGVILAVVLRERHVRSLELVAAPAVT